MTSGTPGLAVPPPGYADSGTGGFNSGSDSTAATFEGVPQVLGPFPVEFSDIPNDGDVFDLVTLPVGKVGPATSPQNGDIYLDGSGNVVIHSGGVPVTVA